MKPYILSLLLCLVVVYSPTFAQDKKIVFSPNWLPQAQFAGYYVALDQGFYSENGLDVEIIHGSTNTNIFGLLNDGKVDVVTHFLVSALYAIEDNIDVVNIAQYSQRSSILLVSKKTSGIEQLEDLKNKRVGIWNGGSSELPKVMIRERQLQVEWQVSSTMNLFLLDGVDLVTVMWYNEYNHLRMAGIESKDMNTFFLSDYGYDIPEDGLYTLRSTRLQRPDDLRAFVEATNKGWEFASKNRDYTVNLVVGRMKAAKIASNRSHQRWMLDRTLELQLPIVGVAGKHELSKDSYRTTMSILRDNGFVQKEIDFDTFYMPVLKRQK